MKEAHKRSRNPAYKTKYRVTNWPQYEQSLRNRGSLTLWISPSAIKSWKSPKSGKPGRQQQYTNLVIETILTLRLLFHLPLRQGTGNIKPFSISQHLIILHQSPLKKPKNREKSPFLRSLDPNSHPIRCNFQP